MTTARDVQRSRVYDAEHLVHRLFDRSGEYPMIEVAGSRITLPVERRLASIDSVQSYVDQVLGLGWVRASWARATVPVARARARRRFPGPLRARGRRDGDAADRGAGADTAWAMRELVVLHELSHHLADGPEVAHGPEFVDRMLTVVDGIIGPEAYCCASPCWTTGCGSREHPRRSAFRRLHPRAVTGLRSPA